MSIEQRSAATETTAQHPHRDPLEGLGDGEVLRCRDPETGWTWYYSISDGGEVQKFHCYHGFEGQVVSHTEALGTINCEGVISATVGQRQLDVLRGQGE